MNLTILILNIIGTFLVSVEAIKIDNLSRLIKILTKSTNILNPEIEWIDEKDKCAVEKGKNIFFILIAVLFYPLSFIILYYLIQLNFIWSLIIALPGIPVLWTIMLGVTIFLVRTLKLIEVNTSKGIIGIIGFIVLTISFFFQFIMAK